MSVLRTLGELQFNGSSTSGLSSPRIGLTLLAYLARRSPRPVSRGDLADLFWRERDPAKARQSLRQILLELKRLVGDGLVTDADRVFLAPGTLDLDSAGFEGHVAGARWEEAVESWKGEFLAAADNLGGEDFRLWLEAEREGLHRGLRLALRALIGQARGDGDWKQGIGWAERWVDLLPLEEEGQRHLIELTHLDGRTPEALARHAAFQANLHRMGAVPTPVFVQLGTALENGAAGASGRRTPGSAALFTPDLTGRGHALAELGAVWRGVRQGRPAVVLVEGEAGIGKSRLCDEFLRQIAAGDRVTVLRARGHEVAGQLPLGVVAEMAISIVSAPGASGTSPAALAELAQIAPVIRERYPSLPKPSGMGHRLEDALVEVLDAAATELPVILYFDDLPLAAPATQELLISVSSRVTSPVLFLVTARTWEHQPPAYVELASRAGIRRLKLQPLSLGDIEVLLGSMLELAPPAKHHLAQRLHAETGGNPFFTVELTAALVDEGLLSPTDAGAWRLEPSEARKPIPLPATIRDVVGRRLDRLSPEARSAVEAAAVLGRTFDPALVPLVDDTGPATWAVAQEELIARRIIRDCTDATGGYEFTHEIICRVAYDLLPPARRQALHRSAARAWQARMPRSPEAKAAQHYHRIRAGSSPRIPRWSRRALAGAAVLILAVAVALMLTPPARRASLVTLLTRSTPRLDSHRIVVAPLTNHTGDSALAGLGAMAADWIAQGLMRTTQFEVVDPRTTTLAGRIVSGIPALLRDRNPAIALAEETGAGTVLSGDLFTDGDSLRVLMRVIDAASGKIVRAVVPVSGTAAAPSRLVSTLSEHVLAAVASAVDTTSRGFSAALGQPPSYEAYTEVSKAWESFFRDDLADVFRRLQRATILDSEYMTPLLMRAYVETRVEGWPAVDTLVRRLEAHSSILTPAELAVLAGLEADLKGDLWGRLHAARELMSLTPASVEGYTLAASSALFVNRPREALTILSRVDPDRGLLLVAPFYWINQAPALHRLGDHRAELESARQGLRRFPDNSSTHLNLLTALAALGDLKALRRESPRVARDDPDPRLAARQNSLWVWRELRAHGHGAAAAQWLADLPAQPPPSGADSSLAVVLVEGDLLSSADRWADARRVYAAALPRYSGTPALLGRLGVTAAHLGDRAEAQRLDSTLAHLERPYLFGTQTYARARIASALGDRAHAVDLLRSAWAQGRPLGFNDRENEDVHSDPEFESLRDFFGFQLLMRTD